MKNKKNKKGFTLAELLIVVAIIAVLVAIAIPIFTSQLEKSRDAVSISNIRAAYAEAQTAYLTEDTTMGYSKTNSGATVTINNVMIKSQQGNNWSGLAAELPFIGTGSGTETIAAFNALDKGQNAAVNVVFTYTDGKISGVSF